MLYGMSLAVGLPPAAWLPPTPGVLPTVHQTTGLDLDLATVATALGQPVTELGRGRFALGEVDRRLHGLNLSLDLFRVGVGRGMLVPLGVIRSDRRTHRIGGATPADLWVLAREAIPRYGVVWNCGPGLGIDAILVHYGSATFQLAWLGADYVATVSATRVGDNHERATEMAHALARLLASRLEPRVFGR